MSKAMKSPYQIAADMAYEYGLGTAGMHGVDLMESAIEADRAQRDIVALIAATLDDRGASDAADLVRDTDPDDDLWNDYIGPMLDELEDDYGRCEAHGHHLDV